MTPERRAELLRHAEWCVANEHEPHKPMPLEATPRSPILHSEMVELLHAHESLGLIVSALMAAGFSRLTVNAPPTAAPDIVFKVTT